MSNNPISFYWYDLETTGTNARWDRIVQFAGMRTDADLKPIEQPHTTYIKLPPQVLPSPDAALITGITPQLLQDQGTDEFSAICAIHDHLIQPNTCTVGYNNLSFDDEFIRFALFRNLLPPYKREFDKGNSRFDLFNVVRATAALQPHLLEWPRDAEGVVSSKLANVAHANGIDSSAAHDALADVEMSIAVAKKIKQGNEKFWQYLLFNRGKHDVEVILQQDGRFHIHVHSMFGAKRHFAAPIKVLARHPTIKSRVIFADLSQDLTMLETATPQELNEARFLSKEEAEENQRERLAVAEFAVNKCPVLLARKNLSQEMADHLDVNLDMLAKNLEMFDRIDDGTLEKRVHEMVAINERTRGDEDDRDVSEQLYDGFISNSDERYCQQVHEAIEQKWRWPTLNTRDKRIETLSQRLQFELFPDSVHPEYADLHWDWVQSCLLHEKRGIKSHRERIKELRDTELSETQYQLLDSIETYSETVAETYDV